MPAPRTVPQSAPETPGLPDPLETLDALPAIAPAPPAPTPAHPHESPDASTDVVRWAAFSCVLVPVVLVWYGTSLAGATGAALGLAAVTAVCRILLRQSERGAAHAAHTDRTPRPMTEARTPHATPHRARHGQPTSRARGGGRNTGTSTPVD